MSLIDDNPVEAKLVLQRFDSWKVLNPYEFRHCEYGHIGCSYVDNGPCVKEAESVFLKFLSSIE